MCSTSESSERFLLKQVKDKENTFTVRKVKLQKRKLLIKICDGNGRQNINTTREFALLQTSNVCKFLSN